MLWVKINELLKKQKSEFMYLQNCKEQVLEDGKVKISGPGIISGKMQSVVVEKENLKQWKNGLHAQDAFPNLTSDEREFLISGIDIGSFEEFLNQ